VSVGQILAAVVAVAIVAAAVRRRHALSGEAKLLAAAAVIACGVYASGLLSELPDLKTLIADIAQALGAWTYVVVALMAYLETGAFVGLVAPGETVVIAGGVIAGQGEIELVPLIGLVWICAILGDSTSFFIGRRLGRAFLEKHGPRVKITHERLEQVDGYFERHGGKTILVGRFIGLVRAIAPFVAGSSGMPFRRFIPYSIVGTGLWATTFCVLGYIFWRSFDRVAHIAGQAIFGFGLTVGFVVAVVVAYRRRAWIRAWLIDHQRHPLLRPLFAVARPVRRRVVRPVAHALAPEARFLGDRLAPGGLGLELTTALAAGGVGLYVFALYTMVLSGDLGPTPLDRELLDVADQLNAQAAVTGAKIVTSLGSFPACAALVAVTAIVLALRRRPTELVALLVSFALIYVAVHIAKAAIDRPRPASPLVTTDGSTFPSGHAAYGTAWLAVAVVFTRRLRLVRHAGLIAGATVLVAAIGLSRIYLRAHYWSDVAGGWGLGVGIFALIGAIAMIVEHMRHNVDEPEPRQEPAAMASAER
jgi:membrane protein DedA with SNARE-associated domain/membrane-associated phospholipid phosphatase